MKGEKIWYTVKFSLIVNFSRLIAVAPNWTADREDRPPRNEPIGVLETPTIHTSKSRAT